jgi:hypothetical protein
MTRDNGGTLNNDSRAAAMSKRRERLLTACCLAVGVVCVVFPLAVRRTAQTLYVCNPQLESAPGVRLMDPTLGRALPRIETICCESVTLIDAL